MEKYRKNITIALAVLVVAIVGMTVAYAAMSTTLNVKFGNVVQNALTWNVGFATGTITGTAGGTSATGRTCGNATATASSVTVAATNLSKPGDSCTWALTVKNTGGIAAKLSSITPTKPTSTTCGTASGGTLVCGNITYKLTKSDGSTVLTAANAGTLTASSGSLALKLIATYTGSTLNSTAVTQNGAAFTLIWGQA